ncbi:MAG: permease [Pirellulaceae bacterium]
MNTSLSFAMRFVQAAAFAAPYVICGLVLAGVLRVLVRPSRVRKALDGDAVSGPLRGWAFGLLLPVCSLGALPVCRELLRLGVSRRTVFAFLLAAPLFHPLTLAYALSVMDVALLAVMLAGSAIVVALASRLVTVLEPAEQSRDEASAVKPERVPFGLRRMLAIGVVAAEKLRGAYLGEIALGLIGAGLVGGLLRADTVGGALAQEGAWAGPLACSLGAAIYMTPEQAIAVLDQMFGHGNSLAAAFALLICGVGLNLGTLLAIRNMFGARSLLGGLAMVFVVVMVVGSMANATVYNPTLSAGDDHAGHEGEGHTHAFDPYARPAALTGESVSLDTAWRITAESCPRSGMIAVLLVIGLGCAGAAIRSPKNRERLQRFLSADGDDGQADSALHRPLSSKWLTAIFVLGCASLGYTGLLVYFPNAKTVLAEMQSVHTDAQLAVRNGRTVEAHSSLTQWEQLARRLAMGSLLRGQANGDQRVSAQHVRQQIGALRAALDGDDPQRIEQSWGDCDAAYRQCRAVFAEGQPFVMHSQSDEEMPDKITDEAERGLYLSPGGIYTAADIAANGGQTASQRFAGFRSSHDMNPPTGSLICPVTQTKANPQCTWIVNGKTYQFCCPPCVDEFVRMAKESPEEIKEPEDYVKR